MAIRKISSKDKKTEKEGNRKTGGAIKVTGLDQEAVDEARIKKGRVKPPFPHLPSFNIASIVLSYYDLKLEVK